ncbi:MAG: tRNA (adenosine(37)-N6)-dimethylallyltransferase MiaA [Eubacteriales bacterium]|nr:tRNA (adenosine(37)-N6)-dimethylallyltransferase MiaA [Eubacteriales bacterium]
MCGPTASGKSAVAVELCRLIGGEVVSCDSMQLYRGMDVGTATPTEAEMGGVAHHLLNILDPSESFSAAAYRARAIPVIEDIRARGRIPVLCGGTGLYVNALTRPLGFAEPGDEALRQALQAVADGPGGRRILHDRLRAIDPDRAARLHENDVRRVIRAIEAHQLTGRTAGERAALDREREGDYRGLLFAPDWPRATLYERIDRRVMEMMHLGLPAEVDALIAAGVPMTATAMQAIGYKELIRAREGFITLDEAVGLIQQGTRRYAKRQLTWFYADPRVQWVPAEERSAQDIAREIKERLQVNGHSVG